MATEVEQLYLQLELINIEEQMLILQILKRRQQRRCLWRWSVRQLNRSRLGTGEFTTPVHPLRDLDEQMHFRYFWMSTGRFDELLRRVQPQLTEITFWAHQSQPLRSASTQRVVRIFRRCTSGYGVGVHINGVTTEKYKLRLSVVGFIRYTWMRKVLLKKIIIILNLVRNAQSVDCKLTAVALLSNLSKHLLSSWNAESGRALHTSAKFLRLRRAKSA